MWLSSKEAAEILGVNLRTLQRIASKAKKENQKILTIDTQKTMYKYIDGIGGNSGKTLQIWIDDDMFEKDVTNSINHSANSQPAPSCDVVRGGVNVRCDKPAPSCGAVSDKYSSDDKSKSLSSDVVRGGMTGSFGSGFGGCDLRSNSVGGALRGSRSHLNLEPLSTDSKALNLDDKGSKFSHIKTLNEKQKLEVIAYAKKYSVKKAKKFFGISDKNIYRWLKEFENGGIKEIKDRRGKRIKADLILIKQAILSIGNAHKSSWWMEYVRRFCLTNNLEFNAFNLEADISKSTFYRHANKLIKKDADIRNFLRGGLDTLSDMNLSVKREYLVENEEWQIDATSFDFMCLNENNEPQRYTAIGMVDAKSGKRVYELADSPNSYANVRLLKKAFIKMGRPGYIKGDNGKDYVGSHFQGVLARLGVSYIAAAPFKGAQKGVIERAHGVMQNFFEALPGFIGHNAGARIKKENEALEKSKRLSGAKTNIKNLLTKNEMQSMIDSWCDKKYGVNKGVDSSWFDEKMLGKAYQRRLNAGGISINNIIYQSLELYRYVKIGSSVEVIEDIDDASKVYVYHKGEFICEIIHSEVKNITAEEVKKAKKEYQKTHITPTKNYIKSLRDEKDAYYKEVAKQNLDEKMKAKNSVIKKESAAKKVEDEDNSGGEIYLPDINEVLKEFVG